MHHGIGASSEQLDRMQQAGVFLCPTLEGLWCRLQVPDATGDELREARSEWEGVTELFKRVIRLNSGRPFSNLLFGSDAGSYNTPHASLDELRWMIELGLSPVDAFTAATTNGARFLKMEDRLAALKPGFVADMIFWKTDPLALSVNDWRRAKEFIAGVMMDGNIVHGED